MRILPPPSWPMSLIRMALDCFCLPVRLPSLGKVQQDKHQNTLPYTFREWLFTMLEPPFPELTTACLIFKSQHLVLNFHCRWVPMLSCCMEMDFVYFFHYVQTNNVVGCASESDHPQMSLPKCGPFHSEDTQLKLDFCCLGPSCKSSTLFLDEHSLSLSLSLLTHPSNIFKTRLLLPLFFLSLDYPRCFICTFILSLWTKSRRLWILQNH